MPVIVAADAACYLEVMKAFAFGLLSLALAGCGGSDGDFTGKWTCTTTFTTPNLPPFIETDPWTGVDLGNGIITISDDDVHSCPAVKLKVDGDNASLVAGQSCAVSDGTQVQVARPELAP